MKSMLVIGLGRFGQHLASNLLDLENDVMIIDVDEKKLEGLVPYATSSKIGDCTNPEVLRSLGIGNFDVMHDWLISRSMFYFLNLTAYGLVP